MDFNQHLVQFLVYKERKGNREENNIHLVVNNMTLYSELLNIKTSDNLKIVVLVIRGSTELKYQ